MSCSKNLSSTVDHCLSSILLTASIGFIPSFSINPSSLLNALRTLLVMGFFLNFFHSSNKSSGISCGLSSLISSRVKETLLSLTLLCVFLLSSLVTGLVTGIVARFSPNPFTIFVKCICVFWQMSLVLGLWPVLSKSNSFKILSERQYQEVLSYPFLLKLPFNKSPCFIQLLSIVLISLGEK